MCGIYGLKNTTNGKWYIGQALDLIRRKREHFRKLRKGIHNNLHLQQSFNEFGINSFEFRILEIVEMDMLDMREISWIRYFNSNNNKFGYNMEGGGNSKKRLSAETIVKLRAINLGRKHTEEARRNMSRAAKCRAPMSEKTREKMSQASKLRAPMSAETKAKLSASHMGKPFSESHRQNLKKAWKMRGPVSEETRRKISLAHKGRVFTQDHCEKISKGRKGWVPTLETRKRMSLGVKKRPPVSEETRLKMSISQHNRYNKQETINN